MSYTCAVFDLDGTILDTLDDLNDALNRTLDAFGMPCVTRARTRSLVGNGLRSTAERAVPAGTPPELVEEVCAAFAADYGAHSNEATRPYAGIPELLEELKARGVRVAVVSNKADAVVKDLVAYHFPGAFEAVAGESPTVRRKPAPDSTERVLELMGVEKENACYIGDSEVDVLTAANAGLDCISCTWGFRDEDELVEAGATCIVHTTDDLLEAVVG